MKGIEKILFYFAVFCWIFKYPLVLPIAIAICVLAFVPSASWWYLLAHITLWMCVLMVVFGFFLDSWLRRISQKSQKNRCIK